MRRVSSVGILVVFFGFLAVSDSCAYFGDSDITERWGVGFNISEAVPTESEADDHIYLGGTVLYGIQENWAIQVDLGYVEFSHEAFDMDHGDLEGWPLLVNVQWRHPVELMKNVDSALYGLFGLGVILWEFQNSDRIEQGGIAASADDAFALRIGAGLDVFLRPNIAWNLEGAYTFSSTDIDFEQRGTTEKNQANTDFWLIGSGLRLYY